ncbi:hypothetical protein QUF76_18600 [Desulfobacterales bacterium HSG16]|nr:hypothetical protein [Desulfobacterales bacterium HSG16]
MFDATGAKFNKDAISVLVKFVKGNKPYIKAVAVVGIDGMLRIALGTVSRLSGRSFKMFKNRQTASKWLIQQ